MQNDKTPTINIGLAVRQKMSEQGTTIAWLARQVDCDSGNLHKQLQKFYIYPELLERISVALNFDFFVYHSNHVRQIIENKQNKDTV